MKNIYVEEVNTVFDSEDGILIMLLYQFTELYIYFFRIKHEIGVYEIKKQVTIIKWASFMYYKLSSIVHPDSVKTNKGCAFAISSISSINL